MREEGTDEDAPAQPVQRRMRRFELGYRVSTVASIWIGVGEAGIEHRDELAAVECQRVTGPDLGNAVWPGEAPVGAPGQDLAGEQGPVQRTASDWNDLPQPRVNAPDGKRRIDGDAEADNMREVWRHVRSSLGEACILRHHAVLQKGQGMSPLMIVILRFTRGGALLAAGFVGAVLGLELWRYSVSARPPDTGFIVVLALLMAGFLLLARSIARELAKPGS